MLPVSNHLSLYAETPQSQFKEFYSDTFIQTDTAKIGGSDLVNPVDATATTSDVLLGKTAYLKLGKATGIMPNNGYLSYQSSGTDQTIPAGYTSGGIITGISMEDLPEYQALLAQSNYLLWGGDPYVRVEYLEATSSNPYINTGYRHNANTKVEIQFYQASSNTSSYLGIFGARQANYNNYCYTFFSRFNGARYCYSRTGAETTGSSFYDKKVTLTTYQKVATFTDGTTTYTITTGGTPNAGTNDFLLFNLNTGGAGAVALDNANSAGLRIYYCKIWDDDGITLVRDYIPVKRLADEQYYMYDRVSQSYVSGIGTFIAGPLI